MLLTTHLWHCLIWVWHAVRLFVKLYQHHNFVINILWKIYTQLKFCFYVLYLITIGFDLFQFELTILLLREKKSNLKYTDNNFITMETGIILNSKKVGFCFFFVFLLFENLFCDLLCCFFFFFSSFSVVFVLFVN